MSDFTKGQGAKIGILFTEELVGDVTGNANAFTVSGKQYKYINGELIDGDYQIDKIERYPTPKEWKWDFEEGTLIDVQITPQGLTLGVK